MSAPILGRNAVIMKGTQAIGYATGVTTSIDVDIIKAYNLGSDKPVVLESGNKSFSVSIERMYIDSAFASDVLSGTKVTIEIRPQGTGTGKPKITLSNVVFNSWEMEITQDGVIMESVEGEGTDIAFGTQS